jgi:hypothetical protein
MEQRDDGFEAVFRLPPFKALSSHIAISRLCSASVRSLFKALLKKKGVLRQHLRLLRDGGVLGQL